MPDVLVLVSDELGAMLTLKELGSIETASRVATAREMSCENYRFEHEELDPQDSIDYGVIVGDGSLEVRTAHGDPASVRVAGVINIRPADDLTVKIWAFDYPDRMRNLDDRLVAIGTQIKSVLPAGVNKVSVTFCRLQEGDWVSV